MFYFLSKPFYKTSLRNVFKWAFGKLYNIYKASFVKVYFKMTSI